MVNEICFIEEVQEHVSPQVDRVTSLKRVRIHLKRRQRCFITFTPSVYLYQRHVSPQINRVTNLKEYGYVQRGDDVFKKNILLHLLHRFTFIRDTF
jgi:hypothetical protein